MHANGNVGIDLKLDESGKLPLFFDRRISLPGAPDGKPVFPMFFKVWLKTKRGHFLEGGFEGNDRRWER